MKFVTCGLTVVVLPLAIGFCCGYSQGFAAAFNAHSSEAATISLVLTKIRSKDIEAAVSLLEMHLDTLLVCNTVGREARRLNPFSFNLKDPNKSTDFLAAQGARYRLDHPHAGLQPEYQAMIESVAKQVLDSQSK